ncbi:MAG TPA: type VI secretion system accessory protein TagJ [Blastocatellia bacterium]
MVTVQQQIDAGDLQAALAQLSGEVKEHPTDDRRRTLLFELLSFAGDWDRAERQLDILAQESVKVDVGAQIYRNNIKAERDRGRLFSEGLTPHFLIDPPNYVGLHLDAINRIRDDKFNGARELLDRAEEEQPACEGTLNDEQFLDFRDYNDITGPVLELIITDRYYWVPLEQVKVLGIERPKRLRDLLWATARIETTSGTVGEAFIPALYPGSHNHSDQQIKLGRKTDWNQIGEGLYTGAGLKLFLVDDRDRSLFEIRTVQFGNIDFTTAPLPM